MQVVNLQGLEKTLFYDSGNLRATATFNPKAIFNNINITKCYVKVITYASGCEIQIAYNTISNVKETYKLNSKSTGYLALNCFIDDVYVIVKGSDYQVLIKAAIM